MERASQKIRHLLQTYKDSLVILKEVEDGIDGEGSTDDVLIQVSRIMGTAVGKLIADVEVAVGSCVEPQRKALLEGDPKGKRKVLSDHLVRAGVKAKRRAVLKGGICYQHGEHLEVMDPLLWGNLPVPLLELVFDRVMLKIHDSTQCRSIRLTDPQRPNKIRRLMYTNSGNNLLALGSNAVHKLWKWLANIRNPSGKATASVPPLLWQPLHGMLLTNDTIDINPEEAMHCIALSKNDSYIVSASGGMVSLFNIMTFKVMMRCMAPSPAVTFLVFFPRDNNIIAVGMEDSTIRIYNLRVDKVMANLQGHQERITSLAFSSACNVLVSAGADAQLCLWSTETWKKRCTQPVQVDSGGSSQFKGDIHIEFHCDQTRAKKMDELKLNRSLVGAFGYKYLLRFQYPIFQWVRQNRCWAPLSNAAYSCDGELVFAGFVDGSVAIFDADRLLPRCQLAPSVYIPQAVSGPIVYPLVIAAHPKKPNQFALGLSDGSVQVIEPLKSEEEWGTLTILPYLHS